MEEAQDNTAAQPREDLANGGGPRAAAPKRRAPSPKRQAPAPKRRSRASQAKSRVAAEDKSARDSKAARGAHARDAVAAKRDVAAQLRDRAAASRDREAEVLDDAAEGLDATEAPRAGREPRWVADIRERAAADRVEASLDRARATSDRLEAARDREESRTLMSAVILSGALDRASASVDEDRLWDMSVDLLAVADLDGYFTRVSASWERALGYSRTELMSRRYLELVHPDDANKTLTSVNELLDGQHPAVHFDNRYRAKDGSYRALVWSARASGDPSVIYFVVRDVTAARSGARELNTTLEQLRQGFESAPIGMLVTHPGGTGAARVNAAMRELTGRREDELLACESFADFTHPDDATGALAALARLSTGELEYDEAEERLLRPDGSEVWVLRSAMPLRDAAGTTSALFVQAVDISEPKRREEIVNRGVEEIGWVERIRDAIDHDRLVLYAQPIIALATREVVQHELLLRMLDADGELIPPLDFLPSAEKYGLIEELDAWVISQAVKFAAGGGPVEVNLSGASIGAPRILEHIQRELRQRGADPSKLVLEVTETALVEDIERGELFAKDLAALGCRFALDDFGRLFGGTTYLQRLPAKYLKIDIEFVRDLRHSRPSRDVVKAIVALAGDHGQETIAEGVEDEETLVLLRHLGVDFAQGYHIGRPVRHDTARVRADPARSAAVS